RRVRQADVIQGVSNAARVKRVGGSEQAVSRGGQGIATSATRVPFLPDRANRRRQPPGADPTRRLTPPVRQSAVARDYFLSSFAPLSSFFACSSMDRFRASGSPAAAATAL